jgi:hypothetical protein
MTLLFRTRLENTYLQAEEGEIEELVDVLEPESVTHASLCIAHWACIRSSASQHELVQYQCYTLCHLPNMSFYMKYDLCYFSKYVII